MKKNRKTIVALLAALLLAGISVAGLASCSDNVTSSDLEGDGYDYEGIFNGIISG